jgi:transposase
MWVLLRPPLFRGAGMQAITTIGLDIAKSVFQVHGVDAVGRVVAPLIRTISAWGFRQAVDPQIVAPRIRLL